MFPIEILTIEEGKGWQMTITTKDVAQWMLNEIEKVKYLDQETAVDHISANFGDDFVYENENGNLAIEQKVLAAFRKLTDDSIVWERSSRLWRYREESDEPGRQQW